MNDFFFSLMLMGALGSSDTSLPFWATSNRYGLMPENDGMLALVQAGRPFDEGKTFQWRWGASFAANYYENAVMPEEQKAHMMLDELYVSGRWKMFTVDAGMKHDELDFLSPGSLGSISTSGGHIISSGNARSLPGYRITMDPVPIPLTFKRIWLYGAFGDYKTLDQRFMQDALVHRTKFFLKFVFSERLDFNLGLDHYALWGGHNDNYNPMTIDLDNYIRVIFGQHASTEGTWSDQLNVIGDHGGGEQMRLNWRGDGYKIVLQHDIPYSDGSGMGLQNFPDGVNTVYFGWDDKDRWISDVAYEYSYTMFQSGPFHEESFDEFGNSTTPKGASTTGGDNHFNNGEYRSGWSHFGRMIGDPLFFMKGTRAGTWTSAKISTGIESNRFTSHHLGLAGKLWRKAPYRLMLTYSANYGTYGAPYTGESQWNKPWGTVKETPLRQVSGAFEGEIPYTVKCGGRTCALDLVYGLFADKGQLLPDQIGLSLGVRLSL